MIVAPVRDVTGSYAVDAAGFPSGAFVEFWPNVPLHDLVSVSGVGPVRFDLDAAGGFVAPLVPNDTPGLYPQGWVWVCRDPFGRMFWFDLPSDDMSPVPLPSLAPWLYPPPLLSGPAVGPRGPAGPAGATGAQGAPFTFWYTPARPDPEVDLVLPGDLWMREVL